MIRNCVTLKHEQALTSAGCRLSTTSCMGQHTRSSTKLRKELLGVRRWFCLLYFTYRRLLLFYRRLLITKVFWKDNGRPKTQFHPIFTVENIFILSSNIKGCKIKAAWKMFYSEVSTPLVLFYKLQHLTDWNGAQAVWALIAASLTCLSLKI